MKGILSLLIGMTLMGLVNAAFAGDQENLSKALEKGNDVYCNSIKDSDLKNYCQGVVKKQGVYCNSIRDGKLKKECKTKAR